METATILIIFVASLLLLIIFVASLLLGITGYLVYSAFGPSAKNLIDPFEEHEEIYRVFPNGEVQFLHPADGVFPEKVNSGRVGVNNRNFSIGKNPNPIKVKFSGKSTFDA